MDSKIGLMDGREENIHRSRFLGSIVHIDGKESPDARAGIQISRVNRDRKMENMEQPAPFTPRAWKIGGRFATAVSNRLPSRLQ